MAHYNAVSFYEGEWFVNTLSREEEKVQAYRLRHQVFAQNLSWVPAASNGLEVDQYDVWATSVGIFSGAGKLAGSFRMLPTEGPFMLEREFQSALGSVSQLRRAPDTTEITRLAVDPHIQDKGLSSHLMLVLFKGVYQWSLENDVRFLYMVVEKRFLRVLRGIGFPCNPLSGGVALPPANAISVPALLDWELFREESARKRPEFLTWMTVPTGQASPIPANGREPVAAHERKTAPVPSASAAVTEGVEDLLVGV